MSSSSVSNSKSDYDSERWWVTHSYYTIHPDMQKTYNLAKNVPSASKQCVNALFAQNPYNQRKNAFWAKN